MFDWPTLIAFIAASQALNLTPGPDLMFISASGAAGGSRAGVAAGLGVVAGCLFHVALAAAGVAALLKAHPAAFDALRYAGAAYLFWLAVKAWRAPPQAEAGRGMADVRRAFLHGAITNMLNPKVFIFIMAFLPQFTDPARGPVWQQIVVLGLIFGIGSIPVNCGVGALAGSATAWIRRTGGTINKIAAVVFGGLAAKLVLD